MQYKGGKLILITKIISKKVIAINDYIKKWLIKVYEFH